MPPGSRPCSGWRRGCEPGQLLQIENVISDRGSKYAVSGGSAPNRAAVDAFLKQLKSDKKYARATHNSWAVLLSDGTPLKGDDGESGAGMVILRMLEREGLHDHVIVVTRWYGGKIYGRRPLPPRAGLRARLPRALRRALIRIKVPGHCLAKKATSFDPSRRPRRMPHTPPRPLGAPTRHYWRVLRMARATGTDLTAQRASGSLPSQQDWAENGRAAAAVAGWRAANAG